MEKTLLVYLTHPHVDAWNFKPVHREILEKEVPGLRVEVCYHSKEFIQRLPEVEAVAVWYFKKEWLEKAPRLKLIATPAAGKDWIDVEPGDRLEISFGGFHGLMIAESVMGAIFYFCKAFELSRNMQKQAKWARKKISDQLRSLYRSRVMILGFGKIGTTIGKVLKPFGCVITGVKRAMTTPPNYFEEGDRIVTTSNLDDELSTIDHLIFVLPGGKDTEGMFTPDHFKAISSSAYIYNVGRGNVFREQDLIMALRSGEIAGAYLDVFEKEPLPADSPLWKMDNVLIQPHLSAASPQYLELFSRELAQRLRTGLWEGRNRQNCHKRT